MKNSVNAQVYGGVEQEKNRFDMWGGFCVGLVMSIFFAQARELFHEPFFGWLFVIIYVGMCIACFLPVYSIHWDDKQTKTTIKMSLVMSVILIPMMLMPFIMDIDTQVHFHKCIGGFGTEGNMHYIYRDYTNYSGVIMFGISIVFCILGMMRPLYHLYKMGK
jgi:hypothetical protein